MQNVKSWNTKVSLGGRNIIDVRRLLSPYDEIMLELVQKYGGFDNAHAHLCRADTINPKYLKHLHSTPLEAASWTLRAKQDATGNLHEGISYTEPDLYERMRRVLDRQVDYGTTRFSTCIDVTPDIDNNGMLAFEVALKLKEEYANRMHIEVGPTPIFGFSRKDANRWLFFKEAAPRADFLAALPEKDDYNRAAHKDGKIGFRRHLQMVLELAADLHKPVQIHLDQANDPNECGTETLIEGLRDFGGITDFRYPEIPLCNGRKLPSIWVIHMISPSCYSEARFRKLIEGLLEFNIGVIVCFTAAISMRQLRSLVSPIHNCCARLLDLCEAGVPVLLGTDNICDLFVPQSDGDMLTEVKLGGHAMRYAVPHVWAKLACGVPLNNIDVDAVRDVLIQDREVWRLANPTWTCA